MERPFPLLGPVVRTHESRRVVGTMTQETRQARLGALTSERTRDYLTVWTVVLLISGQGFRHLLGIPAYAVLCVVTVAAVVVAFRAPLRTLRLPLLLSAFVGLAALTILWSGTRLVTAAAVAVLLVTTYLAVVMMRRASAAEFMVLLYRGFQISLYGGILFELIVAVAIRHPIAPLFGYPQRVADVTARFDPKMWSDNNLFHGGPIQGFVGNRNPFASIALFTAILAFVLLLERCVRRVDAIVTLAAALAVYLLTQSATVTVSAIYITGLVLAAFAIRAVPLPAKRVLSFATLAVTAIAGVLTIKYRSFIFGLLDRSAEATHRTDIWNQVIHVAWQRPEGWGYVGYWPIWDKPYSTIIDHVGVAAPHAHNAFLDSWLQMGLVGLALLTVIVTLLFGSAWRLVERAERSDTFIPLGWALLAAALVLESLTESRLLVEGGWFLLVALYCSGPQVFTLTIVDPNLVHTGSTRAERTG